MSGIDADIHRLAAREKAEVGARADPTLFGLPFVIAGPRHHEHRVRSDTTTRSSAPSTAVSRPEVTEHRRSHRPWGYYDAIDRGERFQVKRIVVRPLGMLSLQKHHHRAEHWVVVRGTAEVTVGSESKSVHENESIYIPIGAVHPLANKGKISLELIEVQTGSYLGGRRHRAIGRCV